MIDSQSVRSAGAPAAGPESTVQVPGKTLGKDDFLRLLVTQLQNQNPLNPLDQNQFLSQTAQFTALEELQNIGKALEEMKQSGGASSLAQAAALIGRTARLSGRDVQLDGTGPVSLAFVLQAPVAGVTVDIMDWQDSPVRQLRVGSQAAGAGAIEWDGRDDLGRPLTPGTYFYRVSAQGGPAGSAAIAAAGPVTGFETQGTRVFYRVGSALGRPQDVVDVQQ